MAIRVLLLADVSSSHTEKWAIGLAEKGYILGIFSLNKTTTEWHKPYKNISILNARTTALTSDSILNKLNYLSVLPNLLSCIKLFSPDVVHAHYASSYGLLGALSKFKPFIISAWGSDIYEFPKKSFIHKAILKFNLSKADKILSTSYAMKGELWNYTSKEVDVIPFGVDINTFYPKQVKTEAEKKIVHIGTIKAMEDIYGIKTIINAVELVKLCLPEIALKIVLIGSGSGTKHYKELVSAKNMEDIFVFTGKIPFCEIPNYHNLLDILLNVSSVDESFGVSVIEGMACEKAVIVSNAPGLKEVVNKHALIVEKENAQQLAKAIMQLIESPELRKQLGVAARKYVLDNYDFRACLQQMSNAYDSVVKRKEKYAFPLDLRLRAQDAA